MGAYAISSGPTFDKEAKQIDSESKSTEDEYLKWKIKKKKTLIIIEINASNFYGHEGRSFF